MDQERQRPYLNENVKFEDSGSPIDDWHVSDFWSWSFSDMTENWLRGILGEYFVARALKLTDEPRQGWKSWDLQTKDGTRIEVKTSGYRQTWHEEGDDESVAEFRINKVSVYCEETKRYSDVKYRPAHIYVFCLHSSKDLKPNPLDVSQWEFFVLAKKTLDRLDQDREDDGQKSIRLSSLKNLGPEYALFQDLAKSIVRVAATVQRKITV